MSQPLSFYFHDYETWGADPKRDRPAQFAGIRTDPELNIISEPDVWYCQLANDYLPHPQAALITGLTPQLCNKKGMTETEFMQRILSRFSEPGSCVLGYNSLRFDDEVTRYSLFRNFFEPYGREWQQGNSRWDLIDVVRACYALRPEGINWPLREDGSPSFKLEHLSKANGLAHEQAHDALSDVYATIAIAKLIKEKQPKLFSYLFELRKKTKVSELIDVAGLTPLVHVSSRFPASSGCISWIVPLAFHPTNKNAVICYNLQADPTPLLTDNIDTLVSKLYTRTADLAEDEERLGLKLIHLNKCPVLANAKTLSIERANELGIDRARCLTHLEWFKQHREIQQKVIELYQQPSDYPNETNPDYQLYNGFISDADKQKMQQLHQLSVEELAINPPLFSDERLNNLLFLYRARNYPQSLTDPEQQKWQRYRTDKLMHGLDNPNLTMEDYSLALENLAHEHASDEQKMKILKALYLYVQSL
ncbi:exodeoxyribonuclease I [Arsukibacterium indicum]|uniref:Exodeoxyribonuclease I n=1 Tax=Arsukibacterium indicum TaxID=2848612 RepID=A0ABS6MNU4_9GAMM|nr:exodeoxyribonuclease I [Arsukibacterium indicum]MBV2129962.1 exodeoxyribonuclease I [Arsukibacterium indicum]